MVLAGGDESVRVEGDVRLAAAGAVAHHRVPWRLVPLPGWFCGQFGDAHEAHGVLAGGGQRVAERRMVQAGKARVAEPSPDAGAAVHRELRHRSAGLPAQLACDAGLRAAGTITALGADALHPGP